MLFVSIALDLSHSFDYSNQRPININFFQWNQEKSSIAQFITRQWESGEGEAETDNAQRNKAQQKAQEMTKKTLEKLPEMV